MYKNHWHNNKTVIWLFHRKIQRHTDMSEISVTYEERRTDNIVGNKKRRPTLAKASIFWMIRQYHSICKYRLTKESIPFSWTRISIASNSNCGKSVAHFPIQKSTEYCKIEPVEEFLWHFCIHQHLFLYKPHLENWT